MTTKEGHRPNINYSQEAGIPITLIEALKSTANLSIHPESNFLRKFKWAGMITIRFESSALKKENEDSESRRIHFIRAAMNNLRSKWRIGHKDFYWVSSTEYGHSGAAHCHIIFSFNPLENKGKRLPDLTEFECSLAESISFVRSKQNIPDRSIGFLWSPKFDDYGLVDYICKKEKGRDFKRFEWSTDGKKWKQTLPEAPMPCTQNNLQTEDSSQETHSSNSLIVNTCQEAITQKWEIKNPESNLILKEPALKVRTKILLRIVDEVRKYRIRQSLKDRCYDLLRILGFR